MSELTIKQLKKIKSVLNRPNSVSKLDDPEERHQLVLHWNWDDGVTPLQWVVEQPDTDKGTALRIYWLSSPGHFHSLINDKEVSAHDQAFVTLITTIEENIKNNFYKSENILFNPTNDDGIDYTKEDGVSTIPSEMLRPTRGSSRELLELSVYINKIYPLTEKHLKTKEKNIEKGLEELKKVNSTVTKGSRPEEIIQALQKFSNTFRAQRRDKFTPQETALFKKLDFVWAEQVCRTYGYEWYLHELHEQVLDYIDFIVLSPDKKYYWSYIGQLMKNFSKTTGDTPFIVEKFNEFKDLEHKIQKEIEEYKKAHPEDTPTQRMIYLRPYPNGIFPASHIDITTNS